MKRVKRIRFGKNGIKVKIEISADVAPGILNRWEHNRLMDEVADGAMRLLSSTVYVDAPLSQIEVR